MNHADRSQDEVGLGARTPSPDCTGDSRGVAPIVSKGGTLSVSGIRYRDRLVHATAFNTAHPQMEIAGGTHDSHTLRTR